MRPAKLNLELIFILTDKDHYCTPELISTSKTRYGYLEKWPFCSITALSSNYNPQNMTYIPAVIIIACLVLKQKF